LAVETEIIADLAVVMTVALAVTFVFEKLRQPILVGYLVSGVIIGPYTPPFSLVKRIDILSLFAELGVILLLFTVGLEFPVAKLRRILRTSLGVAAIEIAAVMGIAYSIGSYMNWNPQDTVFVAAALACSSTTIIAKLLSDMGVISEVPARIVLGVLVVEDLFIVGLLAVLQSFSVMGTLSVQAIAITSLKVLALVGGLLLVGGYLVPKIVDRAAELASQELLLVAILGLCFASSVAAVELGFSAAIGAFIMGVLVASSRAAHRVASDMVPLKNMFGALFFTSIGALMDVRQFLLFLPSAIILTAALAFGKVMGVSLGVRLLGYGRDVAMKASLGMAQVGEFAFIVVKTGQDIGVVSPFVLPMIGVVAGVTTFLTPYALRTAYSKRW